MIYVFVQTQELFIFDYLELSDDFHYILASSFKVYYLTSKLKGPVQKTWIWILFHATHSYLIYVIDYAYIVTIDGSSFIKYNKGCFDHMLM